MKAEGSYSNPSRVSTSSPVPSPVVSSSVQRRALVSSGKASRRDAGVGSREGSADATPSVSATPSIIIMKVDRDFERMRQFLENGELPVYALSQMLRSNDHLDGAWTTPPAEPSNRRRNP